MQAPALHACEEKRLRALRQLGLLDTEPEERFDRYTRLARRLFGVEIVLVTLVDSDRQWFKSRQGLDAPQTSREVSFCGHVVVDDDVMVIPDALNDHRFSDNPLVTSEPNIRFYAGCPVHTADGLPMGTLCLIDSAPRAMSEEDIVLLRDLGAMIEQEFTSQHLATTDELTGLSNRRGFRAVAQHALTMCKRLRVPATLLTFDLNGFKEINDTHGHAEGDRELVRFANVLGATFRDADITARVGGDEFVVLCTGADVVTIAPALERLDAALAESHGPDQSRRRIRYSVGAAPYDQSCPDLDAMIAVSDRRMYEQKHATR